MVDEGGENEFVKQMAFRNNIPHSLPLVKLLRILGLLGTMLLKDDESKQLFYISLGIYPLCFCCQSSYSKLLGEWDWGVFVGVCFCK